MHSIVCGMVGAFLLSKCKVNSMKILIAKNIGIMWNTKSITSNVSMR